MVPPFKPVNFGRYLLTERIAIGGMAEIFSAKIFGAMGFEKSMVIKRILPQFAADAEFLRMFITEAKLVCHLEHPNIVQVHELGEIDGQYYISMEYVNGIDGRQLWRTLAKRKQRLPGVLALLVVSEFLKGLDYAHRAVGPDNQLLGVVHRDVSPSNILISFRGDVKIGDFGIALVQQESKTQAGVLKGKYGYMSPEQVAGLNVDHRSDIFAAGIVLAELLLGRRLFLGRSDFETLDKVMNVRLSVLEQHEDALPREVVRIVRLALQREPADRYQSAREFHDDILEFLYQRGERVNNETLAAFTAQHVAPYLANKGDASTNTGANNSSAAPPARSPILPSGIVPRDMSAATHPSSEDLGAASQGASSQPESPQALDAIQTESPQALDAIQTESPSASAQGLDDDGEFAFEIEMRPGPSGTPPAPSSSENAIRIAPPGSSPSHRPQPRQGRFDADFDPNVGYNAPDGGDDAAPPSAINPASVGRVIAGGFDESQLDAADDLFGPPAATPAGSGAPQQGAFGDALPGSPPQDPPSLGDFASAEPQPLVPLWDNVIDADYQFGAIPQLDLDEGESFTGELHLDGYDADHHRALAQKPQGFIEIPGTELELDTGLDENVAYLIPGVVKTDYGDYADHDDPQVMVSAQLTTADEAGDRDQPDFAGQLSTRTVTKVLFRFGLVEESGVLTLTGPERGGPHREHHTWIHNLIADATKRTATPLSDQRTCEILLEEGQPRLVAADRSEESLIAHLLTNGNLARDDVKTAVLANPHRSLVAALLTAGHLAPLQISRHVTSYVMETVLDTFSWRDGNFAFYRHRKLDHESFPTGMELPKLLATGVDTIDEPTLNSYFEPLRPRRVFPSPTPPAPLEVFNPDDFTTAIFQKISRNETIDTLLSEFAPSDLPRAQRSIYLLIECEFADLA